MYWTSSGRGSTDYCSDQDPSPLPGSCKTGNIVEWYGMYFKHKFYSINVQGNQKFVKIFNNKKVALVLLTLLCLFVFFFFSFLLYSIRPSFLGNQLLSLLT